ncbi:unnamed protein product [Ascophyllum nodosum]
MDETLYNSVLAALEAVHGGYTASEARHAAGQMLEGFKERGDGMPYALYILQTPSPRHTDQVRHFALHVLENVLRVRWLPENDASNQLGKGGQREQQQALKPPVSEPGQPPQLTYEEKQSFKEAMVQVMARGTRDIAHEATFIKIKVSDLVAQLAERDYPQRWENFLDQMMQAWASGPTQAELAMMVLARLIEDCHDIDFRSQIDFNRRDPILRGMNEFLPLLIPALYNFLVQQWTGYQAAASSAGTAVTETYLMKRALELLSKILPWVEEKYMRSDTHDFLPAMAQLMTVRDVRHEALVCLEAMCSRKLSEAHFERLLEHLPDMVQSVKQALAQARSLPLSESLEVHQMLCACLEETIIRNAVTLASEKDFKDKNTRKSELLSKFLDQVLQLTQMPSKRMASNLIQAWQALANKATAKDLPSFVVLVPQLLAAFASHSVMVILLYYYRTDGCTTGYVMAVVLLTSLAHRQFVRFEDDVTDDAVAAEEFVDEDDYFNFMNGFRAQVKTLQLQLSKLNPFHTVVYMLEQAQSLLQHHANGRDNLDAQGFPTWKTEACRSWGTFAALAKGVMVGLPNWCTGGKPPDPEAVFEGGTAAFVSLRCFEMLRTMTALMMEWQPNGSILTQHQVTVLESCRSLLVHESSMLQSLLDKLFAMLEAPDPSINLAAMPSATAVTATPEVEAVRLAASKALVVLATDVSAVLVVALGSICQRVNAILTHNKPSLTVRTYLLELLVVVSNSVKDENERRNFVLDMLKGPMSVWVGDDVSSAVRSPNDLLGWLGITPDLPVDQAAYSPEAPRTQHASAAFQTLRAPLTVLYGLGMRVSVAGDNNKDRGLPRDMDAMVRRGMEGLSAVNPFAVAWSKSLPNLVNMVRCIHMLWAPPTRQRLLSHPVASATLAMIPSAESEANRKNSKFGDYEVSLQQDLQKLPLVTRWCRMLHDLRTVCYNLLGLACRQGALYLAIPAAKVRDVIIGGIFAGLDYIENRHLPGFCSRFVEKYVVCCPPCLVRSHVEPVMFELTKNLMPRLSAAWSPQSAGAQTLRAQDPEKFQVYAMGGALLSEESLDKDELEELRIKHRTMVTRGLADLIHSCLGLRGELLTTVNSKSRGGGNNNILKHEAIRKRRKALLDVLVRGNNGIPPALVIFTVGLIKHWGDAPSCRKALSIATLVLKEYDLRSDPVRQRLSRDLFIGTVDALVEGAPHITGSEWDALILVKDLYVAFGLDRSQSYNRGKNRDDTLRKKLLMLPGVFETDVDLLESKLRNPGNDQRAQKEAMRDVLRRATTVAAAAAKRTGDKGELNSFWQENKGRSAGNKSHNNSHNRYRNRDKHRGHSQGNDYDNPSSDILWQRR